MIGEDFERRFRIWIISRFEPQIADAHFFEEDFHEADETAQREVVVCDDAFDLVEFGEVGGVYGFVAEDAVDGEVACRVGIVGEVVEHGGGDGGGVGAEKEAAGFGGGEGVAVAEGGEGAVLVDAMD